MKQTTNTLKLKRLYIDTQIEHVVYMLRDCVVFVSEGFESLSRVQVQVNDKKLIASVNVVDSNIIQHGEVGLSEGAWKLLAANERDLAIFSHPQPVLSMQHVRAKMYGNKLSKFQFKEILSDIIKGSYSNVELSAFITACAADNLDVDEISAVTIAMVESGQRLSWNKPVVIDKHCVGGLPGNRTTPIVVAIAAEAGLTIPKTSSRAITSPAGTADTMETITNVDLDLAEIKKVVEQENGCFVWGGSVKLSPADDILIRVERALDIDSDSQMIASVLSKKSAAGSTHVIIDMPVGKTAKVRTEEHAEKLSYYFKVVAAALNIKIKIIITDGSQPVGRGIGPSLEAMDVLNVLRNEKNAPMDLKDRAILIAGELLDLAGKTKSGNGQIMAKEILESGRAYEKFKAICRAQGAEKVPQYAKNNENICSEISGKIMSIDNRKLAKVAKLAGAPRVLTAGILIHKKIGDDVRRGEELYTIYAEERAELNYALEYLQSQSTIFEIK